MWLKVLFGLSLAIAVLQLVPMPLTILRVVSPRAADVWGSAASIEAGSGAGGAGGWATVSLAPSFTLYELIRGAFYVLFGWLVYAHVRTKARIETFAWFLFAGACFQAFYGLAEFFGGTPGIFGAPRIDYLDSVTGTFINRNHFAGWLEMVFPVSVGLLLAKANFAAGGGGSLRERVLWLGQERLQKSMLFGIIPVLIGLGIFFSRSRTGIFGFFAALFMISAAMTGARGSLPGPGGAAAWTDRRRLAGVFRAVLVAVVFASLLIGIRPVIERFSFASLAGDARAVYFETTLGIIGDFPMTGSGLGTYVYAYPAYETPFRGESLDHAHNDYLELAAELGIVGAGLLVAVAFGALGVLFARWARRRDPFVRGMGIGCLAGIAVLLLHSLTDFNLHITANAVLFVSLYALAARVIEMKPRRGA